VPGEPVRVFETPPRSNVVVPAPDFDEFFRGNYREVVGYDKPEAWVRRVVVNLAVSSLRRTAAEARALARIGRRRRDVAELPAADDEFWRAVRSLPRRQAQCVALRYFDDHSIDEIAAILEVDPATVRVHLHNARKSLARRLGVPHEKDSE
jgi:RNA polymerase sigma factor (sigma-70 family)